MGKRFVPRLILRFSLVNAMIPAGQIRRRVLPGRHPQQRDACMRLSSRLQHENGSHSRFQVRQLGGCFIDVVLTGTFFTVLPRSRAAYVHDTHHKDTETEPRYTNISSTCHPYTKAGSGWKMQKRVGTARLWRCAPGARPVHAACGCLAAEDGAGAV